MHLLTILKKGGLVPYLLNKNHEPFLNIPHISHIPYYDDISNQAKQLYPNLNVIQEMALFLLVIVMLIFGLLIAIIVVNYLIGYAAAKVIMFIGLNILPHILGLLLFSYYYIAFIMVLWYFGLLAGKTVKQNNELLMPGTIIIHHTKSEHVHTM